MKLMTSVIIILFLFFFQLFSENQVKENNKNKNFQEISEKIFKEAICDTIYWDRLSYICDVFGPRLSGSKNLENALEWMYLEMQKDGFENVCKDSVMVPHWARGLEYCKLIYPFERKMNFIALGGSIATPKNGITAEVFVVNNFEEVEKNKEKIKGKILVYNYEFQNYGQAVRYRFSGAINAARVGAVASLIRSVTPLGLQKVHAGMMVYDDTIPKIPHGAISPEDAALLHRLQNRGITPKITVYTEATTYPDALSYNVMGEIKGSEKPDEIIVFGGHSDSWDLGTGAHDDAGGCLSAWAALHYIKKLGLKPKRTLRCVHWVNEENGVRGGRAYAEKHKDEDHIFALEFDSGVFSPSRIGVNASDSVFDKCKLLEQYLQIIDSVKIEKGGGGVDIGPLMRTGVPGAGLNTNDDGKYFWYHHSDADTFEHIKKQDFLKCAAAIAIFVYLLSESY